jgi:hypothetical protein
MDPSPHVVVLAAVVGEGSIETQRPDDRLALRVADAGRPRRPPAPLDERSG